MAINQNSLAAISAIKPILCEFQLFATKFIYDYFLNEAPSKLSIKKDQTIVTQADLAFSRWLEKALETKAPILSEEGQVCSPLSFPSFILDPIDGTEAFAKIRAECAVSLAYMNSSQIKDKDNWGWIWNPLTGYLGESLALKASNVGDCESLENEKLHGFISRSDSKKGLFSQLKDPEITLIPRSSIAFKLALLADGACDFVISLTPKNIWDIAGGTILCAQRGISLFNKKGEVEKLDTLKIEGPLLWCNNKNYSKVWTSFKKSGFDGF